MMGSIRLNLTKSQMTRNDPPGKARAGVAWISAVAMTATAMAPMMVRRAVVRKVKLESITPPS